MNKILSFKGTIGTNDQEKVIWQYELTEHLFGQAPLTGESLQSFDTEEEAILDLFKTLRYVLGGEVS